MEVYEVDLMKLNVRELLLREERARKQILSPFLSSLGLIPGQGQAGILFHLLQKDHITQRELADICKLNAATMSRNLDKMENMGYLKRETNPDCRRSFLICLTEKGRIEASKVEKFFNQFDAIIGNDISEGDMETFCRILLKICDNLETSADKKELGG